MFQIAYNLTSCFYATQTARRLGVTQTMVAYYEPPAIIEPAPVPCVLLAGGTIEIIGDVLFFTGWERVQSPIPGGEPLFKVSVRTATPLYLTREFVESIQIALAKQLN